MNKHYISKTLALALVVIPATGHAFHWSNEDVGSWADASNWGGGIPSYWHPAEIFNGGTVVFDGSANPDEKVYARDIIIGGYFAGDKGGKLIVNGGTLETQWVIRFGYSGADRPGHIEVNGGKLISGWDNNFTVGFSGEATLKVNNSGEVHSDWFFVGGDITRNVLQDYGHGVATLNDKSRLVNTSGIVLAAGKNSTGDLVVNDSARVDITSGSLYVGYAGNANLVVNGGHVKVAQTTWLGAQSTGNGNVTLNGGVLETARIAKNTGSGSLVFNGGTLKATGNHNSFISGLGRFTVGSAGGTIDTGSYSVATADRAIGSGTLVKAGVGTLSLASGAELGGLHVSEGTLRLGAGQVTNISSVGGELTVNSGATLELLSAAGAPTVLTIEQGGSLVLHGGSYLTFDPTLVTISTDFLKLIPGIDGKVGVYLENFTGLDVGEKIKLIEYMQFADNYGTGFAATDYFELMNSIDDVYSYRFEWVAEAGGTNGLYLTMPGQMIPEPGQTALLSGAVAIAALLVWRRKNFVKSI